MRALENDFEENDALQYAALRNILLRKGKSVEILANYEPAVHYVSEWWKQLFGESEGKDNQGSVPRKCGSDHRSAFHGSVHSGRFPCNVRDRDQYRHSERGAYDR